MKPDLQGVLALALVALAAGWLLRRALLRRKRGECGCASCPVPKPKFKHK